MKRKIFLLFMSLIMLLNVGIGNVYADETGKNALNFRKIYKEHRTYSSAVGISANSLGDIAIGFNDDYINVYDKQGSFKYSFAFEVNGNYFFEFDNENNIVIFSVTDGMRYYFNNDAELIKTEKISDPEELKNYYKNRPDKENVNIDGVNYSLKQVLGYIKFAKTDADGNESVIYETGLQYAVKAFVALTVLAFLAIVICGFIKTISTEMKKYTEV
ncbi:hypothetical protein M972_11810 [Acetivibrio thermocellus AD2]|uniref:Uncharacterized protein n=2 Tax=Acetivibrio thermocellus TaxID=1515 RepID=A0AB36TE48_ACETH|nr:hypothetical protein [Acetivibrio thermocellus]CDG37700.1 hypothetical protein CTHBC1_3143 [Acetivibrio thermocellus BC1]ADU73845.1 hypothetical protein Clo1313_0769 [Acetivibrio thermocellus DSM 1313]ALX07780.1 hypothetical protein AD2_00782 [Acetivibrio thermocellus AD2]ANV75522.1 hypothetical protein LQRI_0781 [Acetivibrio thermocellus DSM 2360]EIC05143.1 hypothetical protein YSBL_0106 [Acetivibrio thermocellus YS]